LEHTHFITWSKIGRVVVIFVCCVANACSGEAHLDIELLLAAVFNAVQPSDWNSWVWSSFLLYFCFFCIIFGSC